MVAVWPDVEDEQLGDEIGARQPRAILDCIDGVPRRERSAEQFANVGEQPDFELFLLLDGFAAQLLAGHARPDGPVAASDLGDNQQRLPHVLGAVIVDVERRRRAGAGPDLVVGDEPPRAILYAPEQRDSPHPWRAAASPSRRRAYA